MAWDLAEAIDYYKTQGAPRDQGAVMSLLREVQKECGGSIPHYALKAMAEGCGVKESYFLVLIKRVPSLRLGEGHCLELCAGPNCGKHRELAALAEAMVKDAPNITLKYVPCMRLCGKGPNLRWDGKLHHKADEKLLRELIKKGEVL